MSGFRLELPRFSGENGPIDAQVWLDDIESFLNAQNVTDEKRKVALATTTFAPNSAAFFWYRTDKRMNPANWDTWDAFTAALRAKFCKPLTLAQQSAEQRKMLLQEKELVDAFYARCIYFQQNKDYALSDVIRASNAYKSLFDTAVKDLFLAGLPTSILSKMLAIDLASATPAAILQAATNAQLAQRQFTPQVAEVDAIRAQNNQKGKKKGNKPPGQPQNPPYQGPPQQPPQGQYRNNNNRAPPPPNRAPRPSPAELASRPLSFCQRCKRWVKHYTHECFVDLTKPPRPPRQYHVNNIDQEQQHQQQQGDHQVHHPQVDTLASFFHPLN